MTATTNRSGRLTKTLGFGRLSLYGVGTIIGAGIYSVIGPAAGSAGEAIWISFLVAAVISAFSGLSYAELASAMPSAGAEHTFLRQALPKAPAVAFAVGLFIAVHGAATFATVGLAFGNYLQTFVAMPPVLVALGLMAIATLINIAGVTKASSVSAVLTTVQVLCLIGFAAFAFSLKGAELASKLGAPDDFGGILQGAAIVFFIYSGYEHMATLSEEAKDPGRDIWRAFMVALCVTTAVYMVVIFGVLALVDARSIASSDFPLVGRRPARAMGRCDRHRRRPACHRERRAKCVDLRKPAAVRHGPRRRPPEGAAADTRQEQESLDRRFRNACRGVHLRRPWRGEVRRQPLVARGHPGVRKRERRRYHPALYQA